MKRSRNYDPKLWLLRKADTERETAYTIGGRTRLTKRKPITLAPVPSLDKPDEEDPITTRHATNKRS